MNIINEARVNEDPTNKLIRDLRKEIEDLRKAAPGSTPTVAPSSVDDRELARLKDLLAAKEHELHATNESFKLKLLISERERNEEVKRLEKLGLLSKLDYDQPSLVNLNEDPQLSEQLLYGLLQGDTTIGGSPSSDIKLTGALIEDSHCILKNTSGSISLKPFDYATTYINGELCNAETRLAHGDRVIIGGNHYFRFNQAQSCQGHRSSQCIDFEFAQQELLTAQNKRYEAKLNKCKEQCDEELIETKNRAKDQLNEQRSFYESKIKSLKNIQDTESYQSNLYKKESQDIVSQLTKEKICLENEVKVARIQVNEIHKKIETPTAVKKCKITELMAETEKELNISIARIKASTPIVQPTNKRLGNTLNQVSSYQISTFIDEANSISKRLNTSNTFSSEDFVDEEVPGSRQTLIKVTNERRKVTTFWTLEKFRSKLEQMKDVYQSYKSSNNERLPNDTDNLFFNSEDVWELQDSLNTSSLLSPRIVSNLDRSHKKRRLSRAIKFSSVSSEDSSSVIKTAEGFLFEAVKDPIEMCLDLASDTAIEETSPPERILQVCDRLLSISNKLSAVGNLIENEKSSLSIECVCLLRQLIEVTRSWFKSLNSDICADDNILLHYTCIVHHVSLMIQGVSNSIVDLVEHSAVGVSSGVITFVCSVARLAINSGVEFISAELQIASDELSTNFFDSCVCEIRSNLKQLSEVKVKVNALSRGDNNNDDLPRKLADYLHSYQTLTNSSHGSPDSIKTMVCRFNRVKETAKIVLQVARGVQMTKPSAKGPFEALLTSARCAVTACSSLPGDNSSLTTAVSCMVVALEKRRMPNMVAVASNSGETGKSLVRSRDIERRINELINQSK